MGRDLLGLGATSHWKKIGIAVAVGSLFFSNLSESQAMLSTALPRGEFCRAALSGSERSERLDLRRQFDSVYDHFVSDNLNRRSFLLGKFAGWRVFILRQQLIKALIEDHLGTAGTDAFLSEFYLAVHRLTRGYESTTAVLHSNFKQHYFVSRLTPADFHSQIVGPLLRQMSMWLTRYTQDHGLKKIAWQEWLQRTVIVSQGRNLRDAAFQMGNGEGLADYATWQTQAVYRRDLIYHRVISGGQITWEDFIAGAHKLIRKSTRRLEDLETWLAPFGLADLGPSVTRFFQDMGMADHFNFDFSQRSLPPPDRLLKERKTDPFAFLGLDWMAEKFTTALLTVDARFVFATDVESLGVRARLLQDAWLARGAPQSEIFALYGEIERDLLLVARSVARMFEFQDASGATVRPLYVGRSGGDELAIFFGNLSPEALAAVQSRIADLKSRRISVLPWNLHVSRLVEVNSQPGKAAEAVRDAVREAQTSMDEAKVEKERGGAVAPGQAGVVRAVR